MADHPYNEDHNTYTDNDQNVLHFWNDDSSYPFFDDFEVEPPTLAHLPSSSTYANEMSSPCNPLEDPLPWDLTYGMYDSLMVPLPLPLPLPLDSNDEPGSTDEGNEAQHMDTGYNDEPDSPSEVNEAQHMNTGYDENTLPLTVWPPAPVRFSCSCCQVLREIIHCNGTHIARLEIHGRVGIICHAIKEIRNNFDSVAPTIEHVMIDFSTQSIESVRQYLVKYCQDQRQAGFDMFRDPLSAFYDALCAGQNWDESSKNADDFIQEFQTETELRPVSERAEGNGERDNNAMEPMNKTGLAAQRERTSNMALNDLQPYFHLPIEAAAQKLSVCPTVLKKICRKNNLERWPHRKIKSLDRKISNLELSLTSTGGAEDMRTQSQLEILRKERNKYCTIDQ